MTLVELFDESGEVLYQPLSDRGWIYHAPTSRSSATWWIRRGSNRHYGTKAVADAVGVSLDDLIAWETETDIWEEEACRAEGYGW